MTVIDGSSASRHQKVYIPGLHRRVCSLRNPLAAATLDLGHVRIRARGTDPLALPGVQRVQIPKGQISSTRIETRRIDERFRSM